MCTTMSLKEQRNAICNEYVAFKIKMQAVKTARGKKASFVPCSPVVIQIRALRSNFCWFSLELI